MVASRPALANILIGDATDPVCESVFRSRGHSVDFKPGLSKVRILFCSPRVPCVFWIMCVDGESVLRRGYVAGVCADGTLLRLLRVCFSDVLHEDERHRAKLLRDRVVVKLRVGPAGPYAGPYLRGT